METNLFHSSYALEVWLKRSVHTGGSQVFFISDSIKPGFPEKYNFRYQNHYLPKFVEYSGSNKCHIHPLRNLRQSNSLQKVLTLAGLILLYQLAYRSYR